MVESKKIIAILGDQGATKIALRVIEVLSEQTLCERTYKSQDYTILKALDQL